MASSSHTLFDDAMEQTFDQLLDQQFDNMFVDLATREKRNEPILTNMKNNTSSYGTIILVIMRYFHLIYFNAVFE